MDRRTEQPSACDLVRFGLPTPRFLRYIGRREFGASTGQRLVRGAELNRVFFLCGTLWAAWTMTGVAHASDCPSFDAAMSEVETSVLSYNFVDADAALDVALKSIACTGDDDARVLARVLRAYGARKLFSDDASTAGRAFAASRELDPNTFEKEVWGAETLATWFGASAAGYGTGSLELVGPEGTSWRVDGRPARGTVTVGAVPHVVRAKGGRAAIVDVPYGQEVRYEDASATPDAVEPPPAVVPAESAPAVPVAAPVETVAAPVEVASAPAPVVDASAGAPVSSVTKAEKPWRDPQNRRGQMLGSAALALGGAGLAGGTYFLAAGKPGSTLLDVANGVGWAAAVTGAGWFVIAGGAQGDRAGVALGGVGLGLLGGGVAAGTYVTARAVPDHSPNAVLLKLANTAGWSLMVGGAVWTGVAFALPTGAVHVGPRSVVWEGRF